MFSKIAVLSIPVNTASSMFLRGQLLFIGTESKSSSTPLSDGRFVSSIYRPDGYFCPLSYPENPLFK
jgi:hypothetical protein